MIIIYIVYNSLCISWISGSFVSAIFGSESR